VDYEQEEDKQVKPRTPGYCTLWVAQASSYGNCLCSRGTTQTDGDGDMSDRIKLAEAMGWTPQVRDVRVPPVWLSQDGEVSRYLFELPDPFTDANDDYAVLEWMKSEQFYPLEGYDYTEWRVAINNALKLKTAIDYKIGDYARAALKVIGVQT